MLASDLVISMVNRATAKPPYQWSDPTLNPTNGMTDLPAHPKAGTKTPAGGNEVFVDSSVQWIKAGNMLNLYSANGNTRNFYFYQEDLGKLAPFIAGLDKGPQ